MATIICMRAAEFSPPAVLPKGVSFLQRTCGTCHAGVVVSARLIETYPGASLACLQCAPPGEAEAPPEAMEEARRILGRPVNGN